MSSSHEETADISDIRLDTLPLPNVTPAPDVEAQQERGPSPVDRIDLQPPYTSINTNTPILSSCFICLNQDKSGQYAIRVPSLRNPSAWILHRKSNKSTETPRTYPTVPLKERGPNTASYPFLSYPYFRCRSEWNRLVFYLRTGFLDEVTESDAAIYQRIKDACFYYKGRWKSWLPCYGVKSVQEVTVRDQSWLC
jgi:hypothetical protein